MISRCCLIELLLLISMIVVFHMAQEIQPWDLPVLPLHPPSQFGNVSAHDKLIPRHLWIAVRDFKEGLNAQMPGLFERNAQWAVHITTNQLKDEFMNTTFANTSLLWAYHMLHPVAGAAKADLWRYAVLWTFGGAYIDDDSDMRTSLDKIIEPEDTLIVSYEKNGFNGNKCYIPRFHLSDFSFLRNSTSEEDKDIFHGRVLLNWALIAAPRHPVLAEVMKNAVDVIKHEYFSDSVLRSMNTMFSWEAIMCATGPSLLTGTAREMVRNGAKGFTYKLASLDFKDYGGKFKAIYVPVRNDPNHYMHKMGKRGQSELLTSYRPDEPVTHETLLSWQGQLVQSQNGKEIFVMDGASRRGLPNYDTFMAMNFTMADVIVITDAKVAAIPLGPPMPKLDYAWPTRRLRN
jgi:mannosyltransferase OCH1-like enzyme